MFILVTLLGTVFSHTHAAFYLANARIISYNWNCGGCSEWKTTTSAAAAMGSNTDDDGVGDGGINVVLFECR